MTNEKNDDARLATASAPQSTADPRGGQQAVPKVTSVMIAASVLECEALLAMSRAKFLQGDLAGFLVSVTEARCKLETLHETIHPKPTAEYFVAAPEAPHVENG